MAVSIEQFITSFLKSFSEPFTAESLLAMLNSMNYKFSLSEVQEFLETDAHVFMLQNGLFITRAGAFTKKIFSFILTKREIEQQAFIPGDRFIPFVDSEISSAFLDFEFLGKTLDKKLITVTDKEANDLFKLYGEEYSTQYIATDPACKDLNLAANDFFLPPVLEMTAVDLSPVFKTISTETAPRPGGLRIFARVTDWANGIVEIFPFLEKKENQYSITDIDYERQKWNEKLENFLSESFDRMGPCSCIEEQLANVFYEHSDVLCTSTCGSLYEFMRWTQKIDFVYYGVESRLWRKNEVIPISQNWLLNDGETPDASSTVFMARPDYIIDSFIKDQCFKKESSLEELIKRITPQDEKLSEEDRKLLSTVIEKRSSFIRKHYNWFADYQLGKIRTKALPLFLEIEAFMRELDCSKKEIQQLPQQEMATLTQLFMHISKILEITSGDMECEDDEIYAMSLSVDGMRDNFFDIKPLISDAMFKIMKKRFTLH